MADTERTINSLEQLNNALIIMGQSLKEACARISEKLYMLCGKDYSVEVWGKAHCSKQYHLAMYGKKKRTRKKNYKIIRKRFYEERKRQWK